MNDKRRKRLTSALDLLRRSESIIDGVLEEERDSMNNMPENLQTSDRFTAMENAVDHLEDAIQNIQDAAQCVEGAINVY